MSSGEEQLECLKRIVLETLKHPEHLRWDVVELDHTITIEITTHADDYGRINGAKGANIKALILIAKEASRRLGKQLLISLEDSEVGEISDVRSPFKPNPNWEGRKLEQMTRQLCALACPAAEIKIANGRRTSTVEIEVCKEEFEVADAIRRWLRTWGKANGRDITTNIITKPDEDLQPERADGRYTRERDPKAA